MTPEKFTNQGIAVFSTYQIEKFGYPEENGFKGRYEVHDTEETLHPWVCDYKDEVNLKINPKTIHRYSRYIRFRTLVAQLIGQRGFSSKRATDFIEGDLHDLLPTNIDYTPPCLVWEALRKMLKRSKQRLFYNRIPALAHHLKLIDLKTMKCSASQIQTVLSDFMVMDRVWGEVSEIVGRKYFPNLKYVALKLFEKHGVELPLDIPKLRTGFKYGEVEPIYDKIWKFIEEKEAEKAFIKEIEAYLE